MMAAVDAMLEAGRQADGHGAAHAPAVDVLVGAVQDLSLARDLPSIMQIVRNAARDLTGADGATFVLRDGDLCYYADEAAIAPLWKGQRFPMSACISGFSMLHRESVAIEDIYQDPRIPVDAYRPTFVKSLCMVPIRKKAPIGAIGSYWADRHHATPDELSLLQALANSTSVAMENVDVYADLERRIADRTRELEAKRQELAREHAALLEVQRQKDELATLVAHDLRSPASAIAFAASMQLRSSDLSACDRRRWSAVFSSADHILRTASNLVDTARSEEGKLVPRRKSIDFDALFSEIKERFSPLADRRDQTISIAHDVPVGAVYADPELLGRVLQNLVDNALRHSPAKSAVSLEAHADAAGVTIEVADEGPGIPAHLRTRAFDRFARLGEEAAVTTGFGLGLSFCQLAVQAHGGAIWIMDNAPRGTRFCARIPAVDQRPADGSPS